MTVWKASRPGRFTLVILAAIAIGIPVIVVAASGWPFVPILLGGWVLAMLVIRSVVVYKIYLGASRKQMESARQEIGRLEARIDEAQRKPRDKN